MLVAVLCALGLLRWSGALRERRLTSQEAARWLVHLDRAEIVGFSLVQAGGRELRFRRARAGWRLKSPVTALADAKAAENQLARMARMMGRPVATQPGAAELQRYGLSPPRGRVELELSSGSRRVLAIGARSPFDGSTYVEDDSGAVFTVEAPVDRWIRSEADAFRERQLLGAAVASVQEVRIRLPSGGCALARAAGGAWVRREAGATPVDPDAAHQALSLLAAIRVQGFAPRPSAGDDHGLGPPHLVFQAILTDGTARTLAFARPVETRAAAGPRATYAQRDGSDDDLCLLVDSITPRMEDAMAKLCAR